MKLLFTPVSVIAGVLAGLVGKKIFERLWGLIFRLVKGLTDHGARRAFARGTGTWPGEERPESE